MGDMPPVKPDRKANVYTGEATVSADVKKEANLFHIVPIAGTGKKRVFCHIAIY